VFRGGPVRLTAERWDDLRTVNKKVNAAIMPERNSEGLAGEKWLIGPSSGDCNDYAVTKRSELLDRGWPTRALLLSEVVTSWGEHHLVLVVRTSAGDLVLDNMASEIRPWTRAPYQWVRIQTPKNPNYWASLGARNV
jgi:predicted transglutaminase-like cysteine proteinase